MNGNSNSPWPMLAGLFVAVGLACGGFFISKTMYNAKVALNTAEAKGLAERRVVADQANWTIAFTVKGPSRDDVADLYRRAESQQARIVELLRGGGFGEEEIRIGVIDYHSREYRDENQVLVDEQHLLTGTIEIETAQVGKVREVRSGLNGLIAQGFDIDNRPPSYRFTKLNEIKPEMLREATRNARVAANEFAENAGVEVGGIRSARQGGFNVRDAGEPYSDTQKIEKDVRVVTTITFYLTE